MNEPTIEAIDEKFEQIAAMTERTVLVLYYTGHGVMAFDNCWTCAIMPYLNE